MSSIFKPPTFKFGGATCNVSSIITQMAECNVSGFRPKSPLYSPSVSAALDADADTEEDVDMFITPAIPSAVSVRFKTVEQPLKIIPELDYIHSVLKISKAQTGLTRLYTDTMKEGVSDMSFKRDLGAVLKLYMGDELINLNPANYVDGCKCDFVIGMERFVCAHSIGGIGLPIKVNWLLSPKSVIAINQHIHLLITYFDQVFKKVTIICVSGEHHRAILMSLKNRSFTSRSDGGTEYTTDAMKELLRRPYFVIEIEGVEFSGTDPIERRIKQLVDLGLGV
jgi:hypothetical protein